MFKMLLAENGIFLSNRQENQIDNKVSQTLCNLQTPTATEKIPLWHDTILNPMHQRSLRTSRATIFDSFSSLSSFLCLRFCGLLISTLQSRMTLQRMDTDGSAPQSQRRPAGREHWNICVLARTKPQNPYTNCRTLVLSMRRGGINR